MPPGQPPSPEDSARSRVRDLTPSGASWGRFEPGTIFAGRFRIVAPLGQGGMGEVYRADDLKLGQTVALKLLPEDLAADPGRLAQFHNEVRIARTISHRNVCRTYDIGDADGTPFLTMEYVDGEDLSSLLRRIGRFPQDKAIEVARQICAGIAAAHERGVLHRDLKPANVMIDGEGHVRITDFGLAAIAGTVRQTFATGTPAYMAPEQLAGRDVSERSDIYSLGLVLFELFTGKRVFEASSLQDLLRLHESDSVRDAFVADPRSRSRGRARDPPVSGARSREASLVRACGVCRAAGRRPAGRGAGGRRNAVARNGGRGGRTERAASGHRPGTRRLHARDARHPGHDLRTGRDDERDPAAAIDGLAAPIAPRICSQQIGYGDEPWRRDARLGLPPRLFRLERPRSHGATTRAPPWPRAAPTP